MKERPDLPTQRKRASKSYDDQQNMSEFAEEAVTLKPEKAKEYPPNLNRIEKNLP
ncbi:hypothetical protein [Paenibacillus sp.]|uniref:hypothetical protein n=1 Tax=Paenibacillus sp. TaxID=58172 RepID=UPI002D409120|nr:hypothetical protein [Paenibacillus sp.]HZG87627.1 hypothetical protein [Paenibacillus sp.]